MLKKTLSVGALLLGAAFITPSVLATTTTTSHVAVADLNALIESAPEKAALVNKMQQKFSLEHDKLVQRSQDLQARIEKLEKNKPTMAQKKADQEKSAIDTEQAKLREDETAFQKNLYTEQDQSMKQLMNSIKQAAEVVAKEKGYHVVIPIVPSQNSDFLYVKPENDITGMIKEVLNKAK